MVIKVYILLYTVIRIWIYQASWSSCERRVWVVASNDKQCLCCKPVNYLRPFGFHTIFVLSQWSGPQRRFSIKIWYAEVKQLVSVICKYNRHVYSTISLGDSSHFKFPAELYMNKISVNQHSVDFVPTGLIFLHFFLSLWTSESSILYTFHFIV